MGEVVNLAHYRTLRAASTRSGVTAPVRVVDATTGHEFEGAPSRDLVLLAGIGQTAYARYSAGQWWPAPNDGYASYAVRVERLR